MGEMNFTSNPQPIGSCSEAQGCLSWKKVRIRIGICKKLFDFLANPNKMGYKTSYNQGCCPYWACRSFAVPALLNRTFQLIFSFS